SSRRRHTSVDCDWSSGVCSSDLDWDLWVGPAPERPYHSAYVPFNWRGWWDFGGGTLADMACHHMDLPYWALDLRYPTLVEADGRSEERRVGNAGRSGRTPRPRKC